MELPLTIEYKSKNNTKKSWTCNLKGNDPQDYVNNMWNSVDEIRNEVNAYVSQMVEDEKRSLPPSTVKAESQGSASH